jgi:hypothetical protein
MSRLSSRGTPTQKLVPTDVNSNSASNDWDLSESSREDKDSETRTASQDSEESPRSSRSDF